MEKLNEDWGEEVENADKMGFSIKKTSTTPNGTSLPEIA